MFSEKSVLVVDDDSGVRESLKLFIEDQIGAIVLMAENGQEALEILQQEPCHLVITDLQMPIMTGLDLTAQIRADPALAPIPVFMLTGRLDSQIRSLAEQAGVTEFFEKPFDLEALMTSIKRILQIV